MVKVSVQAERPKNQWGQEACPGPRLRNEEPGVSVSLGRRRWKDGRPSSSTEQIMFPLPFYSPQALRGAEDTHPPSGGPSSFLSLPIRTLISFGNTLPDHPEIHVFQLPGHPLAWSSWYIKLAIASSWRFSREYRCCSESSSSQSSAT